MILRIKGKDFEIRDEHYSSEFGICVEMSDIMSTKENVEGGFGFYDGNVMNVPQSIPITGKKETVEFKLKNRDIKDGDIRMWNYTGTMTSGQVVELVIFND